MGWVWEFCWAGREGKDDQVRYCVGATFKIHQMGGSKVHMFLFVFVLYSFVTTSSGIPSIHPSISHPQSDSKDHVPSAAWIIPFPLPP